MTGEINFKKAQEMQDELQLLTELEKNENTKKKNGPGGKKSHYEQS